MEQTNKQKGKDFFFGYRPTIIFLASLWCVTIKVLFYLQSHHRLYLSSDLISFRFLWMEMIWVLAAQEVSFTWRKIKRTSSLYRIKRKKIFNYDIQEKIPPEEKKTYFLHQIFTTWSIAICTSKHKKARIGIWKKNSGPCSFICLHVKQPNIHVYIFWFSKRETKCGTFFGTAIAWI